MIISLPSDATGNVIVTVDGKNYTGIIHEGKVVVSISDLSNGVYSFVVYYDGDDKYLNCSYTGNFTISGNVPSNKSNSSIVNVSREGLAVYPTGNPILLLVLALFLLVSSSFIKIKR